MFLVETIVGKIVEPIVNALLDCTVRQCCYVVQCNQNIEEFENKVQKLVDTKTRVDRRIVEASANAEVVEDQVSRWVKEVENRLPTMEDDKKRLLQAKENVKCLDVWSRYRMGREGKKKQPDVTQLIEEGNFDTFAHRPLLTVPLDRAHTINYQIVSSRDLVFDEIIKAIKDDQTYMVGIYGMPGVGKTRTMEEVAQQAKKEGLFDEIGMTVVSENPNLKEIQQKLAESLNLELNKETEAARKELIHTRLKNGKRILVMVDDIWNDGIKLKDIGIPAANDRTPGCKVLLTSRIKDVCLNMGVIDPFQIQVLLQDEAWSLFQQKVGDSINQMSPIAEEVCAQCGGLPLAILAVAGALKYKKSKQIWEDTLDRLKNSTADKSGGKMEELYSRIKLSYQYLDSTEARSIFLLCCLFPEDAEIPIDDLVMYAVGRRLWQGIDSMRKARKEDAFFAA